MSVHDAIHGFSRAHPPEGVYTRDDATGPTRVGCDVAIVGSGSGGAAAAAELAEAGFDVVVLEEGGYHGTQDFDTRTGASIRRLYRDGGATAALGRPPILYQEGRTVGGSSVINGGMAWRTPDRILDGWKSEHGLDGITAASMAPYFERVERRIHVAHQDPESIGLDSKIMQRGAEAKGWRYEENLRNQLHCAGSNNCALGCPTGAKQSTLVTYVPRALHFGARIYANVKVERVTRRGKRATGVEGHVVTRSGGRGPAFTVEAKLVISACGSIHTPALLRRSGFRSPSGQLGRNLSLHPNIKVVAVYDEDVRGWEGVHQAYQIREHQDAGITTMAAVNIPPAILAMSLPHHGQRLGELLADYRRSVVAGLLCEDTSRGRVHVAPGGHPVATYSLNDVDSQRILNGTKLLCELLFETGAKRIMLPFEGVDEAHSLDDARRILAGPIPASAMEVVTVHMMGTARMGGSRSSAVCDEFGRVHDTDRLFICDASLFPSAVGVNPAETIQALSTRNAAHIIENRGRYMT